MTTPLPPSSDTQSPSRTLGGWRTWAALAAALAAIYSATGLLRETQAPDSQMQRADISYDAWSMGVTSVLYDSEGKVEYTLEADRQVHYLNDTTELVNPRLQMSQDNGSNWNITARSGRIHGAAQGGRIERLDLSDQVVVDQALLSGEQVRLNTAFLSIYPTSETMNTDQEVTLTSDYLRQTAVGMHGNLNQNTLTFLSQVRGNYDNPAPQP